jgi:hypothetical protein
VRLVARRRFSWSSDRTLDRTRRCDHCVRFQTSSARPVARSGFSGGPLTGLCPHPVTSNQTRPVGEGAYWTLTGRLCSVSGQSRSASGHLLKSGSKLFFTIPSAISFFLPPHRAPSLSCPNPQPSSRSSIAARAAAAPPPPLNHAPPVLLHCSTCAPSLSSLAAHREGTLANLRDALDLARGPLYAAIDLQL